jgi:hypothetical protein
MIDPLASSSELLLKTSWSGFKMESQTQHSFDIKVAEAEQTIKEAEIERKNESYEQKVARIQQMINEMAQILKDHNKIVKTSS